MKSNTKPHIALLFYSLDCGGVERIIVNLARHFAQRGLIVDILLRQVQGEYLSHLPDNVRIIDLGQGYIENIRHLTAYLRHEQPLNLLANMYPHNELAIIAQFFAKSPTRIIIAIHSILSGQGDIVQFRYPLLSKIHTPLVKLLARLLYRHADEVLAVSHGAAAGIAQVANLPLEKIQVIYNPVIDSELRGKSTQSINHPWFTLGQPPVILAVGRLHKIKDLSTLIRSFAIVRQTQTVKLLILGAGPDEANLRALIAELGLTDNVSLAGFIDNPYPYIRAAKLLVLSSRFEALPAVLIEALALNTPIVATNCPCGASEILDAGKYGELVPVGDHETMAIAILRVLDGEIKPVDDAWLAQFSATTTIQNYLELLHITQ